MEQPIWITGAGGLIGGYLLSTAPDFAHNRIGLTHAELDLSDFAAVRERFRRDRPRLIIHCAALSRTPVCQANPALARRINVEATALLADLAAEIPLVVFSSDLVFDGQAGNYAETAPVNPLSIYGETKAAAESIVLANPHHTVIRTSLNGGISRPGDRGFNEELRSAWLAGKELKLFTDEFRCPIPAQITARAVWELVARNEPGLYHLAGSQRMSRWEIGRALAARWPHLNPKIKPASLREYAGAPRPPDTSLDCSKLQRLLSFPLPGLTSWLAEHPDQPF